MISGILGQDDASRCQTDGEEAPRQVDQSIKAAIGSQSVHLPISRWFCSDAMQSWPETFCL